MTPECPRCGSGPLDAIDNEGAKCRNCGELWDLADLIAETADEGLSADAADQMLRGHDQMSEEEFAAWDDMMIDFEAQPKPITTVEPEQKRRTA